MNTAKYDELAHLFKTLAHPTRLGILNALKIKEHAVHELQEIICCRQANLSQHLSILRKANLVVTRKVGKEIYYARNVEMMRKYSH